MSHLQSIKEVYGGCSSIAIWSRIESDKPPKNGVGNTPFFDTLENVKFNPNIVLCGLNISKKLETPFSNFHSHRSTANDYKLRYAIQDTIFEGAYMTDVIKDFEELISGNVMKYLRSHPDFERQNIEKLHDELQFIGSVEPTIIAFGNDAFKILSRHFQKVFKVPHYSSYICKEKLRETFLELQSKI